jgi:hypothetical protein
MARRKSPKPNRFVWLAMHGGLVIWGLCLIVLAENHREGEMSLPPSERNLPLSNSSLTPGMKSHSPMDAMRQPTDEQPELVQTALNESQLQTRAFPITAEANLSQ